jgi:hypothetical protein
MTKQYPKFWTWKERLGFYFETIETPAGITIDLVGIALIRMVSANFVIEAYGISGAFRQILKVAKAVIIPIFIFSGLLCHIGESGQSKIIW